MNSLKMRPHNTNGKLITFCGLDGCGKSTMIRIVSSELKSLGIDFIVTKQPTDAMRNTEIFRTFMDCPDNSAYEYRSLSLMAAADRIQHANKVILPALREGKTVICDRYIYSCLANLRARGYMGDEWIYEISKNIPKPDLAFFLDLPVDVAVKRVRQRKEEKDRYIDIPLQYHLREQYKDICESNNGILVRSDIDIEKTFSKIERRLQKTFPEKYDFGGVPEDEKYKI